VTHSLNLQNGIYAAADDHIVENTIQVKSFLQLLGQLQQAQQGADPQSISSDSDVPRTSLPGIPSIITGDGAWMIGSISHFKLH